MTKLRVRFSNVWQSSGWQSPTGGGGDPGGSGQITHGSQLTTSNTGYIGGGKTLEQLSPSSGFSTSANGQLIENLNINGQLKVRHDNVTIRNCYCHSTATSHPIKVDPHVTTGLGVTGLLVEFCEVHGDLSTGSSANGVQCTTNAAPGGNRNIVRRCFIHHQADAVRISGGWTVEESFMYVGAKYLTAHNDGVQAQKGPADYDPSLIVRKNKIIMGSLDGTFYAGNACFWVNTINGDVYNVEVNDNWFQCGDVSVGLQLIGDHKDNVNGYQFLGTATVTGNKIVQGWPPQAPGPQSAFRFQVAGNVEQSGNQYVDINGNVLGGAD